MVEQSQSTQKMRMDLANTLIPDLELYDAAFMSYGVHLLHQLVASITRQINMVSSVNPPKRCAWTWRTR